MKGINGNYLLTEPKSFHLLKNIFEWSPTELVQSTKIPLVLTGKNKRWLFYLFGNLQEYGLCDNRTLMGWLCLITINSD